MAEEQTQKKEENIEDKGLSMRDALEVSLIALNEEAKPNGTPESKEPEQSTPEPEQNAAVSEEQGDDALSSDTDKEEPGGLTPPSEYSKEEKADFMQLSRKGQEAQLRLDKSRRRLFEEAKAEKEAVKKAKAEYEGLKTLSDSLTPYLKALGAKESTEVALKKALTVWHDLEYGDPNSNAAAYLKAKGQAVPKELLATPNGAIPDKVFQEKINPLQQQLNQVTDKLAKAERSQQASLKLSVFDALRQEKNGAGKPKYPGLHDESEDGLRFLRKIGSLVYDETPISRDFIAGMRAINPNITYDGLIREAYRLTGGKVDDSEAPKTQETQKHIVRSRIAASSQPGRGTNPARNTVKKYKTYREAAAAALAELNQE